MRVRKGTWTVTSTSRRLAPWVLFAAMMGLADALLAAWWVRSGWGMATSGAALAGLMVFVAWSFRPRP